MKSNILFFTEKRAAVACYAKWHALSTKRDMLTEASHIKVSIHPY